MNASFFGVRVSSSLAEHLRLVGRLTVPLYLPTFFAFPGTGHSGPHAATVCALVRRLVHTGNARYRRTGIRNAGGERSGRFPAGAGGRPPRVMIAGTAVVTASSLVLPFSGLFPLVILYRLIGGFGVALWMVSRFAYIAEAVPLAQRGRAAAMFGGTNRAGMFVGPVIGGVLAEQVGMEVALAEQCRRCRAGFSARDASWRPGGRLSAVCAT